MVPIEALPLVAALGREPFSQDTAKATVDGHHPDDCFAAFDPAAATVGTEGAVDSDGGTPPLPASVETVTPNIGVFIDRGGPSLVLAEQELTPTRPVVDSRGTAGHDVGTTVFKACLVEELSHSLQLNRSVRVQPESEKRDPPTFTRPPRGDVGIAAPHERTSSAVGDDDRQSATPQTAHTDRTLAEIASDLGPNDDFDFDDFAPIAAVPAGGGIGVPLDDDAVFVDSNETAARPSAPTAPNWRVAIRAVAIVDALGIAGGAGRARAFDRIVALLERFPHPTSSRAMEGLAEAGVTLEMIEAAADLKEAFGEDGTLGLLRRFSRTTSGIVFVRARNAQAMPTWRLAYRLVEMLGLDQAVDMVTSEWFAEWRDLPRGTMISSDPRERASFANFSVFVAQKLDEGTVPPRRFCGGVRNPGDEIDEGLTMPFALGGGPGRGLARPEPRRYRFAWPERVPLGDAWDDVQAAGRGLTGAERTAAMKCEYDALMRTGMRKSERDQAVRDMAKPAAKRDKAGCTAKSRSALSPPNSSVPSSSLKGSARGASLTNPVSDGGRKALGWDQVLAAGAGLRGNARDIAISRAYQRLMESKPDEKDAVPQLLDCPSQQADLVGSTAANDDRVAG